MLQESITLSRSTIIRNTLNVKYRQDKHESHDHLRKSMILEKGHSHSHGSEEETLPTDQMVRGFISLLQGPDVLEDSNLPIKDID